MVSNHTLGLLVNVILHVLILFIFLTILFFTVIAKKEKEEIDSQLKNAIDTGVNTLLSSFPEKITKLCMNQKQVYTIIMAFISLTMLKD